MTGIFSKLKNALVKSSDKITSSLSQLSTTRKLDEAFLTELEDILITADIGVKMASEIITDIKKRKFEKTITIEEVKTELAVIITQLLEEQTHQFNLIAGELNVILMCGVNGNGKTTTIGKLAQLYTQQGKKIAIAACDTFRAAATEQIETWARRAGATLFQGKHQADPASVAYQAMTESLKENIDLLFIDTAGRLHNQKNLMQELEKIIRTIKKVKNDAPQHILLVIDGTTGQNALSQVQEFSSSASISGLIITKLDGTAKAGMVVNLVKEFQLPIHFIGIGEKADDLKPFAPSAFAKALTGADLAIAE